MRTIDPDQPGATTGRARTLTGRLLALRPSVPDLIDAGFLIGLLLIAQLGFRSTFDSPRYLSVALIGIVLGVAVAHLANVLVWHWLTVIVLALSTYFLLGGAIALQEDAIAGLIPSVTTLVGLSEMGVLGWKQLLTTLPPVAGDGPFVLLPYLLAVNSGAAGFAVARRTRGVWPALIAPTLLMATIILLGTLRPAAAAAQGLGFAVLAFGWLAVRWHRRRRLSGTGTANLTRVLTGAAVLAVATGGALLLGPVLPGVDAADRVVLRSYVQPPIDLSAYPSPLVGFRKYSSERLDRYYNLDLLRVDGVEANSLVRMAVLDDYSGYAWSATGGTGGPGTGFQRLGSEIPTSAAGEPHEVSIEILAAYEANPDLRHWLPSPGQAVANRFEGPAARNHEAEFRYNLSTFQGLVPDGLKAGDIVRQQVVEVPAIDRSPLESGGAPAIDDQALAFLNAVSGRLAADEGTAWQQLRHVMESLKSGYYSDGTEPGQERYLPGHGQGRLITFLGSDMLVGSDEHYAATLALVANQLGFPARVVMGATVPSDGVVKGRHVRAWVEILASHGKWRTIPPKEFIPTLPPEDVPPETVRDAAPVIVPPPNPVRPPGSFESMFDSEARILQSPNELLDRVLAIVVAVLRWVGPPLAVLGLVAGLILGSKAGRRRSRRTRGAPTTRIAGGWLELLDLARDLGHEVPEAATRREQTLAIGRVDLVALAEHADRSIFAAEDPGEDQVAGYWAEVLRSRRQILGDLPRHRRWLARFTLRSLLPSRIVSAAENGLRRLPRRSRAAQQVGVEA